MAIWSEFRMRQYWNNGHRKDAETSENPHFWVIMESVFLKISKWHLLNVNPEKANKQLLSYNVKMVTCQLIWSQILVSLWFLRMVSKTSEWNWKYICLRLLKLPHICINLRKPGRKRLIDCRMGKWILFHLLRNFIITLFQKSEFFKKMPNTVETKLDGVQNNVYKRHIVNNCLFICWNIKGIRATELW